MGKVYWQMLNGEYVFKRRKYVLTIHLRMPWGASQASEYLLKLVQMKYPYFHTRVTPQQSAVCTRLERVFRV